MGNSSRIFKEPSGRPMQDWIETVPNEGLIRYRHVFNAERVLLTDPKALGEVLVTKNYEFIKPANIRNGLGRILGVGILLAEGDEHKVTLTFLRTMDANANPNQRQRKNLMPAFHFRHVKELYPTFWDKSREMVETMAEAMKKPSENSEKASNVVEVTGWTSRATLDIIGVAGLGGDFGALKDPNNKLIATYRNIFNPPRYARYMQLAGMFVPQWILRALPVKRNTEIEDASAFIKQTCRDLIASKKAKMEKAERTEKDILSVAIESGGFTDEELVNQLMTFLVAGKHYQCDLLWSIKSDIWTGHETTSTAMTWAIYLLSKNKDVQSKLRAEIHSKLPSIRDADAEIDHTDIDDCHYLHAVCNEVLRTWAPVSLTMRTAAHDATINGQLIPKNTIVILCPWAVNNSTKLWGPDAAEFKPERWMAEGQANKGGADSNYSFLTFLHGPRSCIGLGFARAEFACLLAAWFGRFETELENPDFVPEIKGGITAKPKGGLWVKLSEAQGW
ncbi:hypothetical protein M8818_007046 [Zalaria obscura]|uniref:Uncharacterized protein n=1 Tax=Zalaria obscura TaxID=2024903 RepID=A0ACC3S4Y3_9PEZI